MKKKEIVFKREALYNSEDPAEGGYASVMLDILEQEIKEGINPSLILGVDRFDDTSGSVYHKEILSVRLVGDVWRRPDYGEILDFLIVRGFYRVR